MSWLLCKHCKNLFGNAHIQEAIPWIIQQCPKCYPNEVIKIIKEDDVKKVN